MTKTQVTKEALVHQVIPPFQAGIRLSQGLARIVDQLVPHVGRVSPGIDAAGLVSPRLALVIARQQLEARGRAQCLVGLSIFLGAEEGAKVVEQALATLRGPPDHSTRAMAAPWLARILAIARSAKLHRLWRVKP